MDILYLPENVLPERDDVLVPELQGTDRMRLLAQSVGGGPARAIAYLPRGASFFPAGRPDVDFAVDPVTHQILYVESVLSNTDIDLLGMARR